MLYPVTVNLSSNLNHSTSVKKNFKNKSKGNFEGMQTNGCFLLIHARRKKF